MTTPKPCKKCGSTERYADGNCAPCRREYMLHYHRANKAKINQDKRRRYHANPEKQIEQNRRWRQSKPGRVKYFTNGERITAQEWRQLKEKYGNQCLACRRDDINLEVDHIIPTTLGGTNSVDNIQPLCRSCNASKGARIIDYRPNFN